jgi:hypothetical protein
VIVYLTTIPETATTMYWFGSTVTLARAPFEVQWTIVDVPYRGRLWNQVTWLVPT